MSEFKFCPDCSTSQPTTSFTKNKRNSDGLAFYCGGCSRARVMASKRRRVGPPKTLNRQGPKDVPAGRKWCPKCGEVKPEEAFGVSKRQSNGRKAYCRPCFNEIIRENRTKNHGSVRNYQLKQRYGITEADFDRMFAEQGGVCAICRVAPAAHVDHDHDTRRVRGLLCFNCNGALGQFRDRTEVMLRAVAYLRTESFPEHADYALSVVVGRLQEDPRPADEPCPA